MRDPRGEILTQLVELLEPVGLPVYSVVPSNTDTPYLFIGSFIINESNTNKDSFMLDVYFTVELYTGDKSWTGSLLPALNWINLVKQNLIPTKGDKLDLSPYFNNIYLRLENDTGLEQVDSTERTYECIMQFNGMLEQLYSDIEQFNVIHNGDNVTYNGENVVYLKLT